MGLPVPFSYHFYPFSFNLALKDKIPTPHANLEVGAVIICLLRTPEEKGYSDEFIKVLQWTLSLCLKLEMERNILPHCPQFISCVLEHIL